MQVWFAFQEGVQNYVHVVNIAPNNSINTSAKLLYLFDINRFYNSDSLHKVIFERY